MERISFTSTSSSRVSKYLVRTVLELGKHLSIEDAPNYYGLSWSTVNCIEKIHLKKKYKHINLREVKAIGIDEIFMDKMLGHKGGGVTIVRDLEIGTVLEVVQAKRGLH